MICKTSYKLNLRRIKDTKCSTGWRFCWIVQERVDTPNAGDFGESGSSYAQYNIAFIPAYHFHSQPTNKELDSAMQQTIIDTEMEGLQEVAMDVQEDNYSKPCGEEQWLHNADAFHQVVVNIGLGMIIGVLSVVAFIITR